MPIDVGAFVESTANDYGIGRLSAVKDKTATISYFDSPYSDDILHNVPVNTVSTISIYSQTKIYYREPDNGIWKTGRVMNSFGSSYSIQFPNREQRILDIADFQVRWNRPIANPATLLACRINETPYFHSGRHPFMTSLTRQRGACAGMSGLFSAVIDLEKHQIDVVRRVLQDPVQRYLLADEVGLGKTVEAGAIIRQYVLDHPSTHCVLIILLDFRG